MTAYPDPSRLALPANLLAQIAATNTEDALIKVLSESGTGVLLTPEDSGKSWFMLVPSSHESEAGVCELDAWDALSAVFPVQVYRLKKTGRSGKFGLQDLRQKRAYRVSPLPVMRADAPELDDASRSILQGLYGEICQSWRMLTDVRFKLLAFLPAITGAILLTILGRPALAGSGLSLPARAGIAILGFIVTIGIYLYDQRNTELYNDLISRGRRIEAELGIDTGHFRGRLASHNRFVQHDFATGLIYTFTILAWLAALVILLFGW